MKIALLGAQDAGKTEIAKRLARNLNADKTGHHWKVIDGYVEQLTQRTGRQYGRAADYPHNVQIMVERWTQEAEALHQDKHTITCGTIFETLIYAAMIGFDPPPNEDILITQHEYTDTVMRFLGAMADVTFNYDAMFFIPWQQQIEHPASWATVVNAKLPEVLEGKFKYAIELRGTTRQRVTHALETIRFIRDDFDIPASIYADNVRQAVQRSEESSSTQVSESTSMSDV